jgi:hypothetical protein
MFSYKRTCSLTMRHRPLPSAPAPATPPQERVRERRRKEGARERKKKRKRESYYGTLLCAYCRFRLQVYVGLGFRGREQVFTAF